MYPRESTIDTICSLPSKDTTGIIRITSSSHQNMSDSKHPKWAQTAKSRMKHLGLTQDDLIPVLKVTTRGAVGHYFTGRREPSISQLLRLTEKLEISLSELIGGFKDGPPPASPNRERTLPLLDLSSVPEKIGGNTPVASGESVTLTSPPGLALGPDAYAIEVADNALSIDAPKGSQLVIDPSETKCSNKVCVFHLPEFGETYVGVFIKRAGKETLTFQDGSGSIPLEGATFYGRAKVLLPKLL